MRAMATALCLCLANGAAAKDFDFKPYINYPAGSPADAVAIGDVTGDGRDDAILATSYYFDESSDYKLFVYEQTPSGDLAAPVKHSFLANANSVKLALGDLDSNGIQDIVVGHDEGFTIFIARSGKPFIATKQASSATQHLSIADINRDGRLDIIQQGFGQDVQIFYGNGRGGLSSTNQVDTGANAYSDLKVGDITGDGFADLVFSSYPSLLTVYANNKAGGFEPGRFYRNQTDNPWIYDAIAIGDANNDGRNDVIAAIPANSPQSKVWIHHQSNTGALGNPLSMESYDIPEALLAADLDRDGRQDLLAAHGGWLALGHYIQGANGLNEERLSSIPYASHYSKYGLATGDLDSDGCTDAAIADYSGLVVLHGQNCYEPWSMANRHDGDFDGDGKSDILWHNNATGGSVIWRSGDSASRIAMTRITDTGWTIAGTGDFNGDGRSDVLWHHAVTGANVIWRSADYAQQQSITRVTDLNWEIVGIGDFNGDDRDDILWRHKYTGANTIWKSGYSSKAQNLSSANLDWKVVGTGDFDGNGRADILWRHIATGQNALWRNANYTDARNLSTVPDTYWQVAGIGDFDHDGRADILWHHAIDGQNAIWHAGSYATSRALTQITDLKWKIAGIGDYDHDGRSDILWRHSGTGSNTIWRAAESASLQPVTGVTDMNWEITR